MIINNAAARCDVDFWAKHLQNVEENERAELKEICGLRADNLPDALAEMQKQARANPRVKNFMYHADFNPCPHEHLTEAERDRGFEIFEEQRGIPKGQPRIVMEHVKNGRQHWHVIWFRIQDNGRPFSDKLDAKIAHTAARQIEKELGLEKVVSPLTREPGTPRPERAPKPWEMYRAGQSGITIESIEADMAQLRPQCATGKEFHAVLDRHDYILARGDKMTAGQFTLMIIDPAGDEHALARRLKIKTKELNEFMRDVDRAALPGLHRAKEMQEQRHIAKLEADRDYLRDEIKWEQALDRAGIEHEERERRFLEPEEETRAGATAAKAPEPQPEPDITELLKRQLAEVDKLIYGGFTPDEMRQQLAELDKALAAELYEHQKKYPNHFRTHRQDQIPPSIAAEIEKLAAADREREAAAQHDPARDEMAWLDSVARAGIAKEDREREFVEPRAEKPQPEKETRAGGTNEQQREQQPAPPSNPKGAAAHFRDALQHSDTPEAFALALDQRKIMLACATQLEAHQSRARASFARRFDNFAPEYAEGEIVAVTYQGHVYKLNERNTGMKPEDMAAFLEPLDRRALKGITETLEIQTRARHDRNELHWATTPQPEKPQQHATGLTMQEAPATSPALHFQDAARQTAQPEAAPDMPADLRGTAAEIWTAYNSRRIDREWQRENADGTKEAMRDRITLKGGRDPLKFGMALDERGLILARATKEEAEQSQKDADHWKQHGEYQPAYREGEFVVINRAGDVYSLNRRTTGHSAKEVQAFLNKAEWKALPGIEAGRQTMKARADERLTAARDRAAIWDAIRLKNATRKRGGRGNGRVGEPAAPNLARASGRAIGGLLGSALSKLADGFSLDALTPKEKYEAAKRDDRNEREADKNADYAAYTAELHERWRRDQQRQAEDKQREPERGR